MPLEKRQGTSFITMNAVSYTHLDVYKRQAMLRSPGRPSTLARRSYPIAPPARLLESEPPRSVSDDAGATIRVRAAHVDGLVERFDVIDRVREGVASGAEHARETARALRGFRMSLVEALRLIGAPRPWGAPAAALARMEGVVGALSLIHI